MAVDSKAPQNASDYRLLGPIDIGECLVSCLIDWDCADLTARTVNHATFNPVYCGVGTNRKLIGVTQDNPGANTLTVNAPSTLVSELYGLIKNGCFINLAEVGCDGSGVMYRMVNIGAQTSSGVRTANGVNATDAIRTEDLTITFDNIEPWGSPAASIPSLFVTDGGIYEQAPEGSIDGFNRLFTLDPIPFDLTADPDYGFPVIVTLNGALLEVDVDYTLTNGVLTLTEAPACGSSLLARWYTEEYLINGRRALKVWFCDHASCGYGASGSCSDTCSNGCQVIHALFAGNEDTQSDLCGITAQGKSTIFATFHLNSAGGINWVANEIVTDALDPVDAVCAEFCSTLSSLIATKTQVYSEFNGGFVEEGNDFSNIVAVARSSTRELVYALFGLSGVAVRDTKAKWNIVRRNPASGNQMTHIDAEGCGVIIGGENREIRTSRDEGKSWATSYLPDAGYRILDVAVGIPNELALTTPHYYVLATDGIRQTRLYASTDGRTWSDRYAWNDVPQCNAQLEIAIDDWFLYVSIDEKLYRNFNYGCSNCESWADVSNQDACCCSVFAVCPETPTTTVMFCPPSDKFVVDDYFCVQPDSVNEFNVGANDVALASECNDCVVDFTTMRIVGEPTQGQANVIEGGVIQYTADPGASGTDLITYQVNGSCPETCCDTAVILIRFVSIGAVNDEFDVDYQVPTVLDILANDVFPASTTTLEVLTSPALGTLTVNDDNTLTYTGTSCGGTETIAYRLTDSLCGLFSDATVTINIIPPENALLCNDQPIAGCDNCGSCLTCDQG